MENTRKCPYCGEEIMADAKKCRHCGEWLNNEAEPKQKPVQETTKQELENQQKTHPIVGASSVSELGVKTKPTKSNKILFFIIAIVVLIALAVSGMFLFGLLGPKNESTVARNKLEKELETLVTNAYKTKEIYDLRTPEFKELEDAADVPGYLPCLEWDYFYDVDFCFGCDPGDDVDPVKKQYDHTKLSNVKADLFEENEAHVYVTLEHEGESEPTTIILEMMRDYQKGEWLVDDVRTTGEFAASIKEFLINCAKENEGVDDYVEDDSNDYGEVLEDESTLDLGSVLYEDYYNPRFDFSVSYPTFFVRKYEAANQDGCEFEYGNNYSMKAYGMNNVLEKTIKELFKDSKSSKDTYSTCKDNWFVLSGINEQGNIYYRKTMLANDIEYTVELIYPQEKKEQYDAVVQKVVNSFKVPKTEGTSIGKMVIIDGSELRLRLGPSTSSETLKWGDGSNRHPEVGEKFRYLDESGDFFKIDYKGNEVWVSKQFTHIEMQ